MRRTWDELLAAFQFLTRLPVPSPRYSTDLMSRAGKFFPLVGLIVGSLAALLYSVLAQTLPRSLLALVILTFLVLLTGGFHEDALADAADGFGGAWNRERVLEIMRDSRVGSYGAIAIGLSLLWRFVLLVNLPDARFGIYVIAAHVLCRWTALPLSHVLPPARTDGSGVTIAQRTSRTDLIIGSILMLLAVTACLKSSAWLPIAATIVVVLLSGKYFQRRLGGVTGDCFGVSNQLSEIAVYFCGCVAR